MYRHANLAWDALNTKRRIPLTRETRVMSLYDRVKKRENLGCQWGGREEREHVSEI